METLAYDLLLEAAMRAQHFHARNLRTEGSWKWLLLEFADYYGVSDSYSKLRYFKDQFPFPTMFTNIWFMLRCFLRFLANFTQLLIVADIFHMS